MAQQPETSNDVRGYINAKLSSGPSIDANSIKDDKIYLPILTEIQTYVVDNKLSELTESLETNDTSTLSNIIESYIRRKYQSLAVNKEGLSYIVNRCVQDMTGFSFLNQYFAQKDKIEEININAWNAIEVKWCDGRDEIIPDHFISPEHARDVMSRILRQTGKYLDENKIYAISYIGKSVRIVVLARPIVDEEIGIAASIRFIHSAVFKTQKLIEVDFMTEEMAEMLRQFTRHGVSMCICGSTGSGKTTLCNALLEDIPPMMRVITLEGGTREFELVRYNPDGTINNNRLHLQTRPNRTEELNVDLQTLLDLVLKCDPEVVVVGEMVSEEAFIASETARTGHTVMTTIHSNNAADAYYYGW